MKGLPHRTVILQCNGGNSGGPGYSFLRQLCPFWLDNEQIGEALVMQCLLRTHNYVVLAVPFDLLLERNPPSVGKRRVIAPLMISYSSLCSG